MAELTKDWLRISIEGMETNRELFPGDLDDNHDKVLEALKLALASMEQEPVGEVVLGDYDDCGDYPDAKVVCIAADNQADWSNFRNGTKLYEAPQLPQPAVAHDLRDSFEAWAISKGWNIERGVTSGDYASMWTYDAWEMVNACRAAMLQGAEPVSQPYTLRDGWVAVPVDPTHEMLNAWLSEIANWHGHVAGYKAMLAAAPDFREISNSSTNCWCCTCRPVTMTDMRFVVCPDCGNKRCPHANDHRNACTESNEPGQEGSAYPAAPHQEVKP